MGTGGYPHFLDWGVAYPTFQDEKVKNLLSPAVNRGDLQSSNYNKTVFGRGSAPNPAIGELTTLSQTQIRTRSKILPPLSPPLSHQDPSAPVNWYPSLFRPELYAHGGGEMWSVWILMCDRGDWKSRCWQFIIIIIIIIIIINHHPSLFQTKVYRK